MADIILTLTTTGTDQGALFDLYSDVDGFTSTFETSVALASLIAGYTTSLAPDGTDIVRICGQNVKCTNCVDIILMYTTTTTTTLTPVGCEETANSGGVGVTEYTLQLDIDGGDLVFDFNAYGVPDKFEILHHDAKKATSGMTVANAGPFDNLYGDPTIPSYAQAIATDQFIGTAKAVPPTRETEIFTELSKTYRANGQQLIWWAYTADNVIEQSYAIVRITGPSGTAWALTRLCAEVTTTTTTTLPTTTTTTTAVPTTTTTTTITGLDEAQISSTTAVSANCGLTLTDTVYVDTVSPGILTAGDTIYTDAGGTTVFVGNGDYYHIDLDGVGTEYTMRVTTSGVVLDPIVGC